MNGLRPPWEIVETFPTADMATFRWWEQQVSTSTGAHELVPALVGRALASYWSVQDGVDGRSWEAVAADRDADVSKAEELASPTGDPDLLAIALLGRLYATWGPDTVLTRRPIIDELVDIRPDVGDEELRLRIREWVVLDHFDAGALAEAKDEIRRFTEEAADTALVLFQRREALWRANVAMLEGRIDEALTLNEDVIAATVDVAGAPFSFQNVAITVAIERYLRCELDDVIEAIRSILATSPRVGPNWTTGLCFSLAEIGEIDEARRLFDQLAVDEFAAVPRDLNWLVTTHLLGLVALRLNDRSRGLLLLGRLRPFAQLDATHGSGYASYGPVGRVVGSLEARWGEPAAAERCLAEVLSTRAPGPWTALTRLDRARALRLSGRGRDALADALRARDELRALELDGWAKQAEQDLVALQLAGHGAPIARLDAGTWTLRHAVGTARVPDGVGIGLLIELLARAGRSISAVELGSAADPTLPVTGPAEPTLDRTARSSYVTRINELEELGEPTDAQREEIAFLRRELAGAQHAPSVSSEIEAARVRVTQALRRAIRRVAEESPPLGHHLEASIRTGRQCLYQPADGTTWTVRRTRPDG